MTVSAGADWIGLDSTRLDSTRLDSTRLDSTRLGQSAWGFQAGSMGRAPAILRRVWSQTRTQSRHVPRPADAIQSWKIIRGDMVEVREGRDKGKRGVVAKVMRQMNQVIVQGVNLLSVKGNEWKWK